MSLLNCYLRSKEDSGTTARCSTATTWKRRPVARQAGGSRGPESVHAGGRGARGRVRGQINTFKADTLEELADKLEIAVRPRSSPA
ncbi:MAG: hypothetical protein ACLTMP_08510 [Eggerthella lenta]